MAVARHIERELKPLLRQWHAGKAVRSLMLGHTQKEEIIAGERRIVQAPPDYHDQDVVHALAFAIIEKCVDEGFDTFADFEASVREAHVELAQTSGEIRDLSTDAVDAAASLAWKALTQGWARAIDGHKDTAYITVKKT